MNADLGIFTRPIERFDNAMPPAPGFQSVGTGYVGGKMNKRPGGLWSSAKYGWDQVTNVAFDGSARFIVLGEERIAPAYVSFLTVQDGNKQYLKALLYAGEGGPYGIESLSDFEVNDQPYTEFEDVTITTRYGTTGQTAIPGYEINSSAVTQDFTFQSSNSYTFTYRASKAVDAVNIAFVWPSGLGYKDAKGDNYSEKHFFTVEYKLSTASSYTKTAPDSSSPWYDKQQAKKELWKAVGHTENAIRMMLALDLPSSGVYDIRVTMDTSKSDNEATKKATITRVEEIVDQPSSHAGMALVAVKFLAQEKLSGGLPKVTCLCRGWKVQNQGDTSAAWTRNPSKLVEAVLTNANDGCGDWITSVMLDNGVGGSWRTVATRCDANAASSGSHKEAHWQLDYVIDAQASARDHLQAMCATFRAELVEWGGKVYLVQDVAGSSVATFDGRQSRSSANRPILALEDGRLDLQETEISADDDSRPTHLKIQYVDRLDEYQRRWTDEIVSPDWTTGYPVVRREIFLPGVTRETQAIREGRFIINRGRLRPKQIEFGVGLGDLDLVPGDLVTLYADSPTYSGKVVQVIAITYGMNGRARVRTLEYSADAYTDTSDTLPARPAWVSRTEALKKARQIPRGASNVTLKEV